jgi:proteasome accessory factor B
MPDSTVKTQRWLDLIALLVGRRVPLEVEDIMERVPAYARKWVHGTAAGRSAARRMFERDKDELKQLGIPLEAVKYRINYGAEELEGYRLQHADFYLPYLRLVADAASAPVTGKPARELPLEEEEARLALDALRHVADLPAFPFAAEARSAFRKLAFDLDLELFAAAPVLWLDPPGQEVLREHLRLLSRALFARKRVSFRYRGIHRGAVTEREVEPYGLFYQRDWYLVGHDLRREALRVFRVARVEDLQPNPRSPKQSDYEIPAGFSVQSYLEREAWELGEEETETIDAAVRFRFPASIQAEHSGWGELMEAHPDGGALRRFEVRQVDPFLRWVLAQEGEAEIVSPPELRRALGQLAADVAALYAPEAGNE